MASNTWTVADPDFGDYADWIEIRNLSTQAVDISGFRIADDQVFAEAWTFPTGTIIAPDSFLLVWADDRNLNPGDQITVDWKQTPHSIKAYHLNFKLNQEGEGVYLWDMAGNFVDLVGYQSQVSDVAYARQDQSLAWGYTGTATPGTRNSYSILSTRKRSGEVSFSATPGYHTAAISLTIEGPPGATVRYTLDGSIPNEASPVYTTAIHIASTTTVRARAWETNKLPGDFNTATYTFEKPLLPHFYITIADNDLNNDAHGIYENSRKDHEVPATLAYFNREGEYQFQVNAGIELFGSTIFQLPQKPFNVSLKGKYGDDVLEYQLFEEKKIFTFKDFVLRNGGNDFELTMMRDGFLASLGAQLKNIDYQGYEPAVVYLNGVYWGIYNIREKMNEDYLAANKKVSPDRLDILEDSLEVNEGSKKDFVALMEFIKTNDFSQQEHYEEVADKINLEAFINYMVLKSYIGYVSFGVNNKYWKSQDKGGLWHWLSFDLEHGFDCCGGHRYNQNTLDFYLNGGNEEFSLVILRKLWENEVFRNQFAQRYLTLLQTTFQPTHVSGLIDSIASNIEDEMYVHLLRWRPGVSFNDWQQEINKLHGFAQLRNTEVKDHLNGILNNAAVFKLSLETTGEGNVLLNDVYIRENQWSGDVYATGAIKIKAQPKPGYKFSEWSNGEKNAEIVWQPSKDSSFRAIFVEDAHSYTGEINNLLVLDDMNKPYVFHDDLIISSAGELQVKAGVTVLMEECANIIVKGRCSMVGEKDFPIIIKSKDSTVSWGNIVLESAADTVFFKHVTIEGAGYGKGGSTYSAISSFDTDLFIDSCHITKSRQPIFTEGGHVHVGHSFLHMDFTGDLINITKTSNAVVYENELRGNREEDTDAIDLDEVISAEVQGNWIYGFRGGNSDGIDLGEGAKNINIYDNEIYHCSDKGISVGQQSTVVVYNNIITLCAQGIGVKDEGSMAEVNNNTFDANVLALASFEKNPGIGGGNIVAKNNLLTNSDDKATLVDQYSVLVLTGNVSNTTSLPSSNLTTEVVYRNDMFFDYKLLSPAVNAGATIAYDSSRHHYVLFNELSYHTADACDAGEWVELANKSGGVEHLKGWAFGDLDAQYEFGDIELAEDGFMVVVKNKEKFQQRHTVPHVGEFDFNLSNEGERIFLFDEKGMIVNSIYYRRGDEWPDNDMVPIILEVSNVNNTKGENWTNYSDCDGTAGQANDIVKGTENEYSHLSVNVYPNPTNGAISIKTSVDWESYQLMDLSGKLVKAGKFQERLFVNQLEAGMYVLRLTGRDGHLSIKIIKY